MGKRWLLCLFHFSGMKFERMNDKMNSKYKIKWKKNVIFLVLLYPRISVDVSPFVFHPESDLMPLCLQ